MTDAPKTWPGFARKGSGGGAPYTGVDVAIPEDRIHFAALNTRVTVTEDPTGDHLGWVRTGHENEPPVMIQHERIFDISFPHGSAEEVRRGHGRIVRLSVSAAEEGAR
ncbi:Uncharacterised protein (plasmid) [Tsukamurella tyrosinosolvens]|uniref:Uncharacterized protein n=1 Tax=Tsukamurella tyrosinosolvens TaxID=57704 RepID=A0A1H4UJL4_TSUTY|nr:hypothetical protein [Tsukamurella tyrosinosolvens]KXO92900.1 hypothetical protein AXK58_13580 [Tsukamurella tyrosinosolvens]SEC68800.1 hypothetical protein SAMN04489793_2923 [Tsukamurella tyrosinosolvens]VEH94268.1 Uncharacterised protein [Tsukamurella tyrosinosolvens]